jgi:glycosyltransferase involved in cell wall biosynthesis
MPKYSIVIPTKDSVDYLKDCIASFISQAYEDYELIISDNHSSDGTYEYVQSLNHPKIRLLKPSDPLSMVDHFEFAVSQAQGEWLHVLGTDDGAMPYFFQAADTLTQIATRKKLKVINWKRCYFFWDGRQDLNGDSGVSFTSFSGIAVKDTRYAIVDALLGRRLYFEIPHLYTMSLIHQSVLKRIHLENNGAIYSSIIHDAATAAAICSVECKYLDSFIPLSWVGSSPKTMGQAVPKGKNADRMNEFLSPRLSWHPLLGSFQEGGIIKNIRIYLYEALLQTAHLRPKLWNKFLFSKRFKTALFAKVLAEIEQDSDKVEVLKHIAELNQIPFQTIIRFKEQKLEKSNNFFNNIYFKYGKRYNVSQMQKMFLYVKRSENPSMRLMDAWHMIEQMDKEQEFTSSFFRSI